MKFHLNSFNGCQLIEWTRNSIAIDQRKITPKVSKTELWFLCTTHRRIVLYNCMKFHLNICSFNGCKLTERTRNSIANDQKDITPKTSKAELWIRHRQTDARGKTICLPTLAGGGGGIITAICS